MNGGKRELLLWILIVILFMVLLSIGSYAKVQGGY